jgi:hypothetical protein
MTEKNKIPKYFLLLPILIILACSKSLLYIPTGQQMAYASTLSPEYDSVYLHYGYEIYRNKCGSCHFLYIPQNYSPSQWAILLPEMSDEAKLTDKEQTYLNAYLMAMSAK